MSAMKSVRLRGLVSALGLLVALTIALTIPAGYGIMAHNREADALQFRAELNAARLARYASGHPEAWQAHTDRLTQILERSEIRQTDTRQRILDSAGRVLAEQGEAARPSLSRSAPIMVSGVRVGTVEAELSLVALLQTGAYVLLFSASLGFSVFMALRAFPMRALDQALGELENANAATRLAYDELQQHHHTLLEREEEIGKQNLRFDAALNNMSQGLSMFDSEGQLIVCNPRYLEIYGFSAEVVRPGVSYRRILEHGTEVGNHSQARFQQIYAAKIAQICEARPANYLAALDDGRVVAISHQPMADGGWVATHEDVTDAKHAEAQIAQQNEMLREREDQLSAQNLWFDAALNNMSLGLCMFDGEQRLIVCNKRFVEMYGVSLDLMRPGTTFQEIVRHRYEAGSGPKQAQEVYIADRTAITAQGVLSNTVVELRDGRVFAIAHQPMPDGGWLATHEDVTQRKQAEVKIQEQNQALREREDQLRTQNVRFDAALNNMSQGLALFDAEQRLTVCNARYIETFGFSPAVVRPGITYRAILEHSAALGNHDKGDVDRIVEQKRAIVREGRVESYHLDLQDGRVIAISHQPMEDGGWVATYEDVTERKRAEARITHMARHDALTDLPNRVLFRERMEEALGRVRRTNEQIAVLCLDLDNFKVVNDTLGHPVGDALLRAVAERIRSVLREGDEVARFGGDEFAVLQHGVERPEDASELSRRLVDVIGRPYLLEGQQINVGVSLGIAMAPGDGQDPDRLLKSADMALYRAKADGRATFRFFEPDMDARVQARRALEIDLRQALVKREFELCFQPLVNLARGEVSGFEALVRWRHPERGMVSPADFIAVAEEIGMIAPLGDWVLRRACAEAASWPGGTKVAVNLSPLQFRTGSLVQVVMSALASSGLAADRLELEITESVLLDRSEGNLATLHQLRALGVRISMDDFGTGYSSLSYLRSFPFDKIKIDRSFVQEIQVNPDCAAIIRAIASLGASLGMTTTAEGVETREQMELIRAEGITEVQGYYYSPPRPANEVAGLLTRIDGAVEHAA